MRKQNGFTLLELILVLALLSMLLAFLLPSMTAYIRRADEQRMLSRARAALLAAQTLLIERYGTEEWTGRAELMPLLNRGPGRPPAPIRAETLLALAEISSESVAEIWVSWDERAAITRFVWTETAGGSFRSAVWSGENWSVRYETPSE